MSSDRQNGPPPIVLTRLWEKTSAKGTTYLTGRLGGAKVLVMPNRDKQNDDDPTHAHGRRGPRQFAAAEWGQPMIPFPGHIFDADARSIDGTVPDLTQEILDTYEHRAMVTRDGVAPVAQAWLLTDDATFAAVPQAIRDIAIEMVLAGKGIILLARRPDTLADVRDGLLDAVGLADVDPGEMPRA